MLENWLGLRQEHGEFKASLGSTAKPCLAGEVGESNCKWK
jgi:hypothetical protein